MRKDSPKKKAKYTGPYQNNPNLHFQDVKKSMRPVTDGPTVDTFSAIDTTISTGSLETSTQKVSTPKPKRPTKEKPKKFDVSTEWVLGTVFGFISLVIGIVIYEHSNKFVSIEKDIEYIEKNIDDQKNQLEKVSEQTITTDRKIDLLNQKVDLRLPKK